MSTTKTFFVNFDFNVSHIVLYVFQHYVNTNNRPCLLWVALMNSLLRVFCFYLFLFLWTSGRQWSATVCGLEPFLGALMTDLNNKDILMLQATGNGAHFWPLTQGVAHGLDLACVYVCLCLEWGKIVLYVCRLYMHISLTSELPTIIMKRW